MSLRVDVQEAVQVLHVRSPDVYDVAIENLPVLLVKVHPRLDDVLGGARVKQPEAPVAGGHPSSEVLTQGEVVLRAVQGQGLP